MGRRIYVDPVLGEALDRKGASQQFQSIDVYPPFLRGSEFLSRKTLAMSSPTIGAYVRVYDELPETPKKASCSTPLHSGLTIKVHPWLSGLMRTSPHRMPLPRGG